MSIDDCYRLGHVIKTHGLRGEVDIFLDVDFPDRYENMESVFLERRGKLIPFFISHLQLLDNKALVKFEDIESLESAKELTGSVLYLPIDQLPSLGPDEYYFHDLVGFQMIDGDQEIGIIEQLYQPSSQYLASIKVNEHEVLIPLEDGIIENVDIKRKVIIVNLPDGLLDVYLSPEENKKSEE